MSRHWSPAESGLHESLQNVTLADDTVVVSVEARERGGKEKPLVTPIYHSATYKMESVEHYTDIIKKGGYLYSRCGNPTCEAAEVAINALEGGAGSLVFSTGMAAITTALLCYLKPGDHVVACHPLYSGAHGFIGKYLACFNIDVTWVPSGSVEEYRKAVKINTKVLYGETPCNPSLDILDLEEFGRLGQSLDGVVTLVDSTLGSPYLQQPVKLGVDISIHSCSKYLGGHSDLVAGSVSCRTLEQWKELMLWRSTLGNTLSPFDASLLLRGVKTLALRMDKHSFNGQKVAEYLQTHSKVKAVHYPGLPTHPAHELAKKQMKSFGGIMAFEMKTMEAAKTVLENVRLIQFAVSLGGVESLIQHPASMTHGPAFMSSRDRAAGGVTDGLIRLSVGVENVHDLIADLEQSLAKV